jgi:ribosomal protein S18 acetylase RimI-like enzyme
MHTSPVDAAAGNVQLSPAQTADAADVLAQAFLEDPSWVWAIPDRTKRRRVQPWFFRAAIRYGLRYGEVHITSAPLKGAAIWLPPNRSALSPRRLMRAGLLPMPLKAGLSSFSRFIVMGRTLEERHRRDVSSPHWYLWLVGVNPAHQGQGVGSVLVRPVLTRADEEDVPCYLDTTLEPNLTFYRRLGFEVLHASRFPRGGPAFWTLLRRPNP